MKAYKLECADDDHGQEVVFAETSNEARRQRSGETCDFGYINVKAKRAEDFDSLDHQPTAADYLSRGWHWQCTGCEKHLFHEDKPIICGEYAFCSESCREKVRAEFAAIESPHESIVALLFTIS